MDAGTFSLTVTAAGTGSQAAQGTATGAAGVAGASWATTFQDVTGLTFGDGDGQCDTLIYQNRELAASASETLDLYATDTVLDVFGAGPGLQAIKAIFIGYGENADGSAAAASFTVGAAASNVLTLNLGGTTPTVTVYADGGPFVASRGFGFTVSNTIKNLKITNNDGSRKLTYRIAVAGVAR